MTVSFWDVPAHCRVGSLATIFACGLGLSITAPCRADEPAADAGAVEPATQLPPDVVMLKSGGMLRGTISEMDPNGEVAIQLVGGELRRMSMSDVQYAGPAANMPKAEPAKPSKTEKKGEEQSGAKPAILVKANEALLKLVANQPDVTFHLKTQSGTFEGVGQGWSARGGPVTAVVSGTSAGYAVICTAPCEATLPTGTHRMALSLGGGTPIEADDSVVLSGPAKLDGTYKSNAGWRVGGWIIGIGGIVGGTVLAFSGDPSSGDQTNFYLGLGVITVSAIVGYVMISIKDSAHFDVVPQADMRASEARRRKQTPRLAGTGFVF